MARLVARSVSRPAKERLCGLQAGRSDTRVLAVFERACGLVTHDGGVVALVLPEIGDGPLNVVVSGVARPFAEVEVGASVTVERARLGVGGLRIDLGDAAAWEPCPDWRVLRGRRDGMASRLPSLRACCLRHAPAGSLLSLLDGCSPSPAEAAHSAVQAAARALRQGWVGDVERLREGAAGLAGLGGGLTPAGDDFLTGVMLWSWLAHPAPSPFCQTLAEVAAPRTTTLSAAFLRAAAQGECSAPWHTLLAVLNGGKDIEITAAVQEILAYGATSGADALAGFLYHSAAFCGG
jgi:hypothetical protein